MENKRQTGTDKESLAAAYLTGEGMEIAERNFRCRQGEIDLVGRHQGYLVFVEVKYRSSLHLGSPAEAVTPLKMRRICRTADYYRARHRIPLSQAVRYDVLSILGEEITWYQNAFPHMGS